MSVVYLTAAAEDRCKQELDFARIIAGTYGDWETAERIRERAYKRLEPYLRVWQPVKREESE
jgi:hypothetical protein